MRKLESLKAWKKSQELAHVAYNLTMMPNLRHHFALIDQIRRAALSVPANIAEGYALASTPQFIRCIRISLGSAAELLSHLEVLQRLAIVPPDSVTTAIVLTDATLSLLVGLLKALSRRSSHASPFPLPSSRT
ncbi:MAG TPA: four helix bundle protein [Gemmatimonadales bacterium]|nr:four helix bundle protein [Gemmatimonadales bacterium]